MRNSCDILIKYDELTFLDYFKKALGNLGFEPLFMDIFFDEFHRPKDDLEYDEEYLMELLSKKIKPQSIMIKNSVYAEGEPYYWLRISLRNDDEFITTLGKNYLFEWSNRDLNFIIDNGFLKEILNSSPFIYCFCFDSADAYQYRDISHDKKERDKQRKSDYSRYTSVRDCGFVAAAEMWFSELYNPVFDILYFNKFKYADFGECAGQTICHIKLFDLYADPSLPENRAKQKAYWNLLITHNVFENYEKNNEIDFDEWVRIKCKRKKSKG